FGLHSKNQWPTVSVKAENPFSAEANHGQPETQKHTDPCRDPGGRCRRGLRAVARTSLQRRLRDGCRPQHPPRIRCRRSRGGAARLAGHQAHPLGRRRESPQSENFLPPCGALRAPWGWTAARLCQPFTESCRTVSAETCRGRAEPDFYRRGEADGASAKNRQKKNTVAQLPKSPGQKFRAFLRCSEWPGAESNRRPSTFQADALPTELPGLSHILYCEVSGPDGI